MARPPKSPAVKQGRELATLNPSGLSNLQKDFEQFLDQPFEEQRKSVDQKWLELAYLLPSKALRLAQTSGKNDLGKLQQIVTAAAIAKDKRFPNNEEQFSIKLPSSLLAAYSVSLTIQPAAAQPTPINVTPDSSTPSIA